MATENLLLQNYTADVCETVKCEICLLTFRTTTERNTHILNHFQQSSCSVCQQSLIRIGDTWYSEHLHNAIPKTELNTDVGNEYTAETVIVPNFVAINFNNVLHENCIENESKPTASVEIDPIFSGMCATQAEDQLMGINAFARPNEFQPEPIFLPEFIEHKPQDIIHNEFIMENEPDECVRYSSAVRQAKDATSKKTYTEKCPICSKIMTKRSFKFHMNIHRGIKPYKCATCDDAFADVRNLQKHVKTWYHKMGNDNTTTSSTRKSTRKSKQNEANPMTSNEIDPISSGSNETQAEDNITVINSFARPNEFQPEQIILPGFVGDNSHEIIQSEYIMESEPDECGDNSFAGCQGEDTNSKKTDTDMCPICGKVMTRRSLKFHMNIHRGLKPYKCVTCNAAFADVRNLHKHVKSSIHKMRNDDATTSRTRKSSRNRKQNETNESNGGISTTERQISHISHLVEPKDESYSQMECEFNEDNGNTRSEDNTLTNLDNNVEDHPMPLATMENTRGDNDNDTIELNPKDVQKDDEQQQQNESQAIEKRTGTGGTCEICNKRIVCRTGLKYHMNIHRGLKPYVCDVCGRAFSDKRNRNEHKKRHLPTKCANPNDYIEIDGVEIILTKEQLAKLECPICNRNFSNRKVLKRHLETHQGKEYKCKLCDKSYARVHQYRWHRRIAHADIDVIPGETVEQEELCIEDYEDGMNASIPIDWMCEYCNLDFEFEMWLAKHIMKEHNEEKQEHPCNICEEKFRQPHDLLLHMRGHPESYQHKCSFDGCGQGFAFKSSLGLHMDKHARLNKPIERKTQDHLANITKIQLNNEEKSELACTICNKKFSSRTCLLAHMQGVHTNKRMKCPIDGCDKIFKSNAGVMGHMQNIHPDAMRECEICKKTFCTEEMLAQHRLSHQREKKQLFACSFCDKKLSTKHELRLHLKHHEKDAACNICGHVFADVKYMLEHRERHGKKPVITCRFKGCNLVFEDRREFMRHTSTHPDNEKRKFICNHCGKAMASKSSLKDHIHSHTGEKPWKCDQCNKCFGRSGMLYRHLMIHSGKKPCVEYI
ncbi:zinc finger protein 62 homolog isoform X2 [Sitodiplosis mosellana]|uniref:zinc finger protein 62 homolog isoform X2 n=1 Tax=Sitodiplosis mosellana TaxID=263140 RepID=UPI002444BC88|nr:zinc finger protein 62 homolog isoform X2 [Sitodiplosis mosellana]